MKVNEDIIIHGRSLKDILVLHKLFLITGGNEGECADLSCVDLTHVSLVGINLSGADLHGANLTHTNLVGINLSGANLHEANLTGAYLNNSKLQGCNLQDAILSDAKLRNCDLFSASLCDTQLNNADLRYANLKNACLLHASLKEAVLIGANLENADLRYANLLGSNLKHANFYGAKLSGVNLEDTLCDSTTRFLTLQCPHEGSFIGYKKASYCVVKLLILEEARRSSATTRKCRCDKAKVLNIEHIETREKIEKVCSDRDKNFIYKVGEVVSVDNFNEDRWVECTTGIHFFMTKHEAETYIG